jgi:two-component system response regulator HydG
MAKKPRILVVDDDSGMCDTLSDILEDAGFEIAVGHDGVEALEHVRKAEFDIVLMDIKMPRMNGVEACKIMRQEKPDLSVFLMTAFTVEHLVSEALSDLGVQVLSKPLDIDNMLDMLRNSLDS